MAALPSETPEFFPRGPGPLLKLTVFGLLSVGLMFVDVRYRALEGVRRIVGTVMAPVVRVAAVPGEALLEVREHLSSLRALVADNEALRRQLLDQATAAQGYGSLRQENDRLRQLLMLQAIHGDEAVAAEVLYSGRDPFSQKVVIDRGETRGVRTGMAVIDESGVLGQVTRVFATLAEVTLITDKDHLVPVQVERSGVRTVLYGSGAGRPPELRFLPPNADIRVGDRLVTSGIDGVYPAGLAVAELAAIDRDPASVFPRVICRPVAGVDRSRQVMVLAFTAPPPRPAEPVESDAGRKGGREHKG